MKKNLSNSNSRNARTLIASLLVYVLLGGQLAPLALATNGALHNAPANRKASRLQPTVQGAPAAPASMAPVPVPLVFVPNITATKTDNIPQATAVNPGDIITYSITITNTGTDATNVTLNDTVDPNTTIIPSSVKSTPIAFPDTYSVLGNVRIQPNAAAGLLVNDIDPDTGNNTGLTASGPATSANGGSVSVNADGSFSYNPPAGFEGADTFTYTITDTTGRTDTALVTLNVTGMIWFINAAAAPGDGRLISPFNCLTGPACFSSLNDGGGVPPGSHPAANDNIFLYSGAYTGGLTLLNGQKLIGQAASATLATIAGVVVPPNSDPLPATGGASPVITSSSNGINIGAGLSNTYRGFTISNTTGAKIAGTGFGTLTVGNNVAPDMLLNGTGQALNLTTGTFAATSAFISVTTTSSGTQGINLAGIAGTVAFGSTTVSGNTTQCILIGTTTANINFGNTSCSGGTDGVSLQNNSAGTRTFGTLGVSGGSGFAFLHAVGGGNTTVSGAAVLTSVSNPVDIQNSGAALINFAGGATVTKTTTGGAGVNLVASSVTFESLGITTSNGTGLSAITSGTITVTNGSKAISATGSAGQTAPAIIANAVTLNANFSNVSSTNSGGGGNGVSLTNVAGTSNFGGGSISGAAGDAFFVSGGVGSVTYNGTISTSTARPVNVTGKTGGTLAFGGAVSSTNNGVSLTTNTGAIINFTGGLNLSTGANDSFTATGGGTVSATQNNTTIVNTLSTTSGTALNVANTTIGALGLTFRSVTSGTGANSASNGIILNTTGSTGGLTVTGNGSAGSGGTIQHKTGADGSTTQGSGIFLNSTAGVSLDRMQLNDFQNYGIRGTSVTGFTLNNTIINGTNGTTAAGGSEEGAVRFDGLFTTGSFAAAQTASISNSTLGGVGVSDSSFSDDLRVINSSGTLNRLTITNTNFGKISTGGNNGLTFTALNNGTVMNLTVQDSFFTNAIGSLATITPNNTSTMDVVVRRNKFSNNNVNQSSGGGGLVIQGGAGASPTVTYDVSCNKFRDSVGIALLVAKGNGGGTMVGDIINNTVGVTGVSLSGSTQAAGIKVKATGSGTHTVMIRDNVVLQTNEEGIFIQNNDGSATLNASVFNNVVAEPGAFSFAGLNVDLGALGTDTSVINVVVGSAGTVGDKNDFSAGDPFNFSDVNLSRITGAGTQLNLSRNGSVSGTAAGVIDDDNLNPATTNTSVSGTVNLVGTLPATPPAVAGCTLPAGPVSDSSSNEIGAKTPDALKAQDHDTARKSQFDVGQPIDSNSPSRSVDVIQISYPASGSASQVDRNKPKPDGGPVARYAAKDTWLSSASQPVASVQKQRGRISLPRPIDKGTANPPVIVGDNITWNIGTLPAGHSVTITVQVQVDDPYSGPPQVSNQGTVTADGGISVLTDDPDAAGANNPTITLVNSININVNDAKAPEPASGSAPMVFTVALSAPASASGVTVHYSTADQAPGPGHAEAGLDYTAVPDTILTFASGEQVKTVSVSILSDALVEPDETFLLNLSNAIGGTIVDGQAIGTITQNVPGTFLISELRTSGPGGPGDDFVELYNNTGSDLTVTASDASAGYGVFKTGTDCNATPVLIATIPNGTIIPARGHYLLVGPAYSLGAYAAGDQTVADIASDSNVAVFSTANVLNLSSANRLDAVGFGSNNVAVCALLQEGTNLQANGPSALQHTFFRDPCGKGGNPATFGACPSGGLPVDLNNNATDFIFADVASTNTLAGQHLGAPGPENLASPIERNSTIALVLLDATKAATAVPNRVRDLANSAPPNTNNGTLSIRRRFVNNTGANVTRLRFRIIDMSSTPVPGGIADLRALSSSLVVVTGIMDTATCTATGTPATPPCQVNVQGTTLETPPSQAIGGSINSSLAAGTITLGTPLAPGASINLQFLLGVMTVGNFKFFVNIEALP